MHGTTGTVLRIYLKKYIGSILIRTRYGNLFPLRRNFRFHTSDTIESLNAPISNPGGKRDTLVTNQPMTFRSTRSSIWKKRIDSWVAAIRWTSRDKLLRIAKQNAARRQQDPDTELNGGVGGLGSSISRTRALEGVRCRGRGVRAGY